MLEATSAATRAETLAATLEETLAATWEETLAATLEEILEETWEETLEEILAEAAVPQAVLWLTMAADTVDPVARARRTVGPAMCILILLCCQGSGIRV